MKKRKINILDLSVILVVLLLIFAATIKFRNYNSDDGVNSVSEKIEYEMVVSNIREYTANAFEVGDKIYDSQTDVEIGKIIEKKVEPTIVYEKIETGEIVKTEMPDRYDLSLIIETDGSINQDGYFANRSIELKIGSEKTIETLYARTTGKIVSLETNEE